MIDDTKVHTLKLIDTSKTSSEDQINECIKALEDAKTRLRDGKFSKLMILMADSTDDEYRYEFCDCNIRHSEKISLLEIVKDCVLRIMFNGG